LYTSAPIVQERPDHLQQHLHLVEAEIPVVEVLAVEAEVAEPRLLRLPYQQQRAVLAQELILTMIKK
jgi:hypothetical protein